MFTDGEFFKLKRSQAQKDYFPQLLFYRLIDKNGPDIDHESDGESNYYIKNSLYTRNAYQQSGEDAMAFYDHLEKGIKDMRIKGEDQIK